MSYNRQILKYYQGLGLKFLKTHTESNDIIQSSKSLRTSIKTKSDKLIAIKPYDDIQVIYPREFDNEISHVEFLWQPDLFNKEAIIFGYDNRMEHMNIETSAPLNLISWLTKLTNEYNLLKNNWDDEGAEKPKLTLFNTFKKFIINVIKDLNYLLPLYSFLPDSTILVNFKSQNGEISFLFEQTNSEIIASYFCKTNGSKSTFKGNLKKQLTENDFEFVSSDIKNIFIKCVIGI